VENSISVMAGLLPAIHVAPLLTNLEKSGGPPMWMTGIGPVMTMSVRLSQAQKRTKFAL
jgi:hypothetical protein